MTEMQLEAPAASTSVEICEARKPDRPIIGVAPHSHSCGVPVDEHRNRHPGAHECGCGHQW